MAKIDSNLLHVLNNIACGQDIKLETPIRFYLKPLLNTGLDEIDKPQEHEIVAVYKKGKIWKMSDDFNNEWSISNLDKRWQHALYLNVLSIYDKRVGTVNYNLSL
jgi:hypothetical protein